MLSWLIPSFITRISLLLASTDRDRRRERIHHIPFTEVLSRISCNAFLSNGVSWMTCRCLHLQMKFLDIKSMTNMVQNLWAGGILLEQPPLNIKDHFMQRRRWILGRLQNIEKFPIIHRFKITFELITYFLVFVSGIISPILTINSQFIPNLHILWSIGQFSHGLNVDMISWSC